MRSTVFDGSVQEGEEFPKSLESLVRRKTACMGAARVHVGRPLKEFCFLRKPLCPINTYTPYTDGFSIQSFNKRWLKHTARPLMVVPAWGVARLFALLSFS